MISLKGCNTLSCRVEEALDSLRYKPVKSTTLERLKISAEADKAVRGYSQPLQFGHGLNYILDHIETPIHPKDLLLGRILEEVPDLEGERFFQDTLRGMGARPSWIKDWGHESFDWSRLLKFGLKGLEDYAIQQLLIHKKEKAKQSVLDFLEGSTLIYGAFRNYAVRYGNAAKAVNLEEASKICLDLSKRAPQTFQEGLQLIWLVGLVFCTICVPNPTLCFGRMDELLLPFYRKDLSNGMITAEKAGVLIEDFYCKNNLILGRGEHQMSNGSEGDTGWDRNFCYDAPQYLILGGTRVDGSQTANELTYLFIQRIIPGFENPVIVLRYTPDFPEDLWEIFSDKMRLNSSILLYNDQL